MASENLALALELLQAGRIIEAAELSGSYGAYGRDA